MDQTCLVIPLRPGTHAAARAWLRALAGSRAGDLARSERRTGISRQSWYAAREETDLLIGLIEARDFTRAMSLLAISMDPFDLWFKRSIATLTGLDLNDPPAIDVAALLSGYAADSAQVPVMARASSIA